MEQRNLGELLRTQTPYQTQDYNRSGWEHYNFPSKTLQENQQHLLHLVFDRAILTFHAIVKGSQTINDVRNKLDKSAYMSNQKEAK